jgi:cell division protein FtsA
MRGIKLEAQVQHIHVDAHDLRTRLDLLSELGIQVQYIAADPLVTPIALLSSEQKDDGCIVIDCGAGTTKISIYTQNSLAWMTVLPVGSDHLTSDLAQALGISRSVAEVLKVRHGRCGNKCQKEMIQVPLLHEKRQQYFHQADLNWVLEMRLKEIFELCLKEIMSCPVPSASLGILLTGGGAQIPGIVALAQDVFHRPVSIGLTQVPATSPFFNNPSSATVVGLLQGMLESENRQQGRHHSLWPHWCQNILSWMAS